MSLSAGTRLGPYEILAPLGAGGMGEVYKARDTRLDRSVAVKVLPTHLSTDPDLKARFEREARAISQLTHPHICTLHDVGNHEGIEYLVMELLEGQTLAQRLEKGALPTEQVLKVGVEIADALDKAHRAGIVHRDLKPGNIMLTKSGVKLLDFGLAKAVGLRSELSDLSSLPTEAERPLTERGTILGTFQYMSPEQLEGTEADVRSDIFALGCVLYEMATGRRAFSGASQASLVTAIMSKEPEPISAAAPMAPPALERIVRTCLAKDPDQRWQSAADAGTLLRWVSDGEPTAAKTTALPRRSAAWPGWAAATAVAAIAIAAFVFRTNPPVRVVRAEIIAPAKAAFALDAGSMVLSPDGKNLAFVAAGEDGRSIWVRPVGSSSARRLLGTDDPTYPFWSPDGRSLGFFSGQKLKRVDLDGGTPQTLCDAPTGRGGAWSPRGVIVFAPAGRGPLAQVPDTGGQPGPVPTGLAAGEVSQRHPVFLPGGRRLLFESWRQTGGELVSEIDAASIDSVDRRTILRARSNVAFVPDATGDAKGWLLFDRDSALLAQRFDAKRLVLSGAPATVAVSVAEFGNSGHAAFTASETGLLAYAAGGEARLSRLTWFDRNGKDLGVLGDPGDYGHVRISHDGRRAAVDIRDRQSSRLDVWTVDLERGVFSRLTFGSTDNNADPVWSPDDRRVAFASTRSSGWDLYVQSSSGAGAQEMLGENDGLLHAPSGWSPDGKLVLESVLGNQASTSNWKILACSVADGRRFPVVVTSASVYDASFSPDGRFITYVSEESGKPQIYAAPFPGNGGRWQISSAGGTSPTWGRDGKTIDYVATDGKLTEVPVTTSPAFETGTPRELFPTHLKTSGGRAPGQLYDVAKDGRFLVNTAAAESRQVPITIVENWTTELQK